MSETVNQGNTASAGAGTQAATAAPAAGAQAAAGEPEKTFTQAEVNSIIADRLKRDRADRADYDELKAKAAKFDELEESQKTELQKATDKAAALQKELDTLKSAETMRLMHEKVAKETGVPAGLLSGDSEESCREQAKEILAFANPGYPAVKDGGETGKTGKGSTREQFAAWASQVF